MASPSTVSETHEQVDIEVNAFQQSSPLSLRHEPPACSPPVVQPHDYNFSSADHEEPVTVPEESSEDDVFGTDHRVFSGCSSISSFPASISQHFPQEVFEDRYASPRTPSKRDSNRMSSSISATGRERVTASPRSVRDHPSPFRHPSSVRALQMKDEIMSDTQSVLRHHRRSGSQMSSYSQRSTLSAQTSPTKRSSRSHRSSPSKGGSNLRKEFPLILLHCTLLPPNLRTKHPSIEDALLIDLLPEEYRESWVALRDKMADIEISSRGVLISHPRDDYTLLEERLLESLELEQPRIRHNHYFQSGGSFTDSGFESGSAGDEAELDVCGPNDIKCPDCGHRIHTEETDAKWEVKVFAANGLMRAGAWAAAWQEMEKVDVEINVWLPEDIRKDLEEKLTLLETTTSPETTELKETWLESEAIREKEVYGEAGRRSSQMNNATDVGEQTPQSPDSTDSAVPPIHQNQNWWIEVRKYTTQDWRNVVLGILGFVVMFFVMNSQRPPIPAGSDLVKVAEIVSTIDTPTTTITETSIATSTTIVTVSGSVSAMVLPPEQASSTEAETLSSEIVIDQSMQTDSHDEEVIVEDDNIQEEYQAVVLADAVQVPDG